MQVIHYVKKKQDYFSIKRQTTVELQNPLVLEKVRYVAYCFMNFIIIILIIRKDSD